MATRTWIGTTSGDWSVTTNWVEGAVPVNGDDVVLRNNAVSISAGLGQSAVTLASLTIDSTYTGLIGLASPLTYLQVGATVVTIGGVSGSSNPGDGSQRILLNLGSVLGTVTIYSSCTVSADSGLEPIRLLGSNASNKLYVLGGRVGVATTVSSETATLTEWDLAGQGILNLGAGCTLTTGNQMGGTASIRSAMTTLSQSAGTLTTSGSGAIATASIGGLAKLNSSGTITALNLYATGTADFTGNPAARTVTTFNHYRGGVLMRLGANPAHVTLTNQNEIQGGTRTLS